jgi:hypothetical protein
MLEICCWLGNTAETATQFTAEVSTKDFILLAYSNVGT